MRPLFALTLRSRACVSPNRGPVAPAALRSCRRRWLSAGRPEGHALTPRSEQQHASELALLTAVQRQREHERRRFGLPVWQLLGGGLLGVAFVARAWKSIADAHDYSGWAPPARPAPNVLRPFSLVLQQEQLDALLSDVRDVLGVHGISLGAAPLRCRLLDEADVEGTTRKVVRPPPLLRGVEAITVRPGLTAIHAAQVLAHEYMHCWLWLQGFPRLGRRLEEGLCELISYLYLLSCLRQPIGGSALARDEEGLRQQIVAIESNAHPDYGGGFRDAAAALRGRQLHQLLSFVREHGRLPPAAPASAEPEVLAEGAGHVELE